MATDTVVCPECWGKGKITGQNPIYDKAGNLIRIEKIVKPCPWCNGQGVVSAK